MQRIIGTEVEYGISSPSDPTANPILTSTQAVLAYAAAAGIQRAKRTRWDYEVESPLRDARGFDLSRSSGPPPIVDADEVGAANMILTNGARLYVDHAHPEYSAPECHRPAGRGRSGTRPASVSWRPPPATSPAFRAPPSCSCTRTTSTARAPPTASHENYLMSAPDAVLGDHRRADPVPGVAAGGHRFRPRRDRALRRRAGLSALPARRLHRGRGGPGDHAQARHHQHPRRTARRRRQVPPAARHHRRRQPRRDVDVPEAGHHRAGARPDRRRRRARDRPQRPGAGAAGARGPRDQPRPVAAGHRRAGRRSRD